MEKKFWKIRRESFALLRKHVHGLHAAPFIDDIVVHPDDYPKFIPELNALLAQFDLMHTIAGHIGDANFHIIPLVNLANPAHRKAIFELTPKLYELVAKYKGSITGEHNDGIIRTPYLNLMYRPEVLALFCTDEAYLRPRKHFQPRQKWAARWPTSKSTWSGRKLRRYTSFNRCRRKNPAIAATERATTTASAKMMLKRASTHPPCPAGAQRR